MHVIACSVPSCSSVVVVNEPCSPDVRYRCRVHDEFFWSVGKQLQRRRATRKPAETRFEEQPVEVSIGQSGFEELEIA